MCNPTKQHNFGASQTQSTNWGYSHIQNLVIRSYYREPQMGGNTLIVLNRIYIHINTHIYIYISNIFRIRTRIRQKHQSEKTKHATQNNNGHHWNKHECDSFHTFSSRGEIERVVSNGDPKKTSVHKLHSSCKWHMPFVCFHLHRKVWVPHQPHRTSRIQWWSKKNRSFNSRLTLLTQGASHP